MSKRRFQWVGCAIPLMLCASGARLLAAEPGVDFSRDIKPILSNICYKCHGPDANERKGGTKGHALRLDTEEGALANYDGTVPVVPGHPEKSELIARITSDDPDEVMPPKKSGKKLTPQEVEMLKKWIAQGGGYAKHWSYVRLARPVPPDVGVQFALLSSELKNRPVNTESWARNPIDAFILKKLVESKLAPQPEADRYTLIRRVTLDLTGLPPTVAEVDRFVSDKSPDAYDKLVDRILVKPAYGEHWARMWLDLARYADSGGYASDTPRTIWAYRDYVIRAFNDNKPFDQFTIEQFAGDLLPNPTEEQFIATAFHRNTMTNTEGGTTREEFRNAAIVDRVNTTMSVWMGSSFACCQCHDHKYDPLPQKDYFRLFAILNNTEDADRADEEPLLKFFTPEQKAARANFDSGIAAIEKKLKTPTPALLAAQAHWEKKFPLDLQWQLLQSASLKSSGTNAMTAQPDGSVLVAKGAKNGSYTIESPVAGKSIAAFRLEALPHDALPGKGPGHADGNFVVTSVHASIVPPPTAHPAGRFVRIELMGKQAFLSLAEVQVFSGAENVALKGEASQISTDFGGDAGRAIDGNTDGDYVKASSTTHTAKADDPWWEVDLKTTRQIDRIAIWNRTDADTGARLKNFRAVLLDEKRQPVWQQEAGEPPNPSATFETGGARELKFATVHADFEQAGFDVSTTIRDASEKKKAEAGKAGWAVGGSTGKVHWLTLLLEKPVEVPPGSKMVVTIEQASPLANHTLGHFRLATTSDPRAEELARTPVEIIALLAVPAAKRDAAQRGKITAYYMQEIAPELNPDREKLAALKKQLAEMKPLTVPVMRELAAGSRRKTNIQLRGNYLSLADEVTEGVPEAFHPLPVGAPPNRLTLAKWLVDPENPLTPRVIANRYWEQIFGTGIVRTSEEFGSQGEPPSHPELLDWLATELLAQKWDMKKFVKLLVMSAAYRQSSQVTPELFEKDPENRLLARGPRFRMTAETVRDQALAVSGLLSPKMFGPSVNPPRPSAGLIAAFGGALDWTTSEGEDKHRRALYTEARRTSPYPSTATFDAPSREICTLRRVRTNTPLQALVTLNDPVFVEAAQALGRRMAAATGAANEKLREGFRACLARAPHEAETERLLKFHAEAVAEFSREPEKAKKLATDPLGPPPAGIDMAELAAWTSVANVLLNLDETLMKR